MHVFKPKEAHAGFFHDSRLLPWRRNSFLLGQTTSQGRTPGTVTLAQRVPAAACACQAGPGKGTPSHPKQAKAKLDSTHILERVTGKNCSKSDYLVSLPLFSQFSAQDLAGNVFQRRKVLEPCQTLNSRHFEDISKKFLCKMELYMGTTVAKQNIFTYKIKAERCLGWQGKFHLE